MVSFPPQSYRSGMLICWPRVTDFNIPLSARPQKVYHVWQAMLA